MAAAGGLSRWSGEAVAAERGGRRLWVMDLRDATLMFLVEAALR